MSPIVFEPWRPPGPDPRFSGLRVLVMGESHYDEGKCYSREETRIFTQDIVKRWALTPEGYQRFFANIRATFLEADAEPEAAGPEAFWTRVFFYNYVQSFVAGGARERPTRAQFAASAEAFHTMLDEVRPEVLVVMSKATWAAMSDRNAVRIERDDEGLGSVWRYEHAGGSCLAAHTAHPSSRGFSADYWGPRLSKFLNYARTTFLR